MAPMEYSWPLLLLHFTFLFSAAFAFLFSVLSLSRRFPPGPAGLPFIGNHSLLGKTIGAVGPTFHRLREAYGPYITLRIGGRPLIFISDHDAAHRALVMAGATFADRPTFSVHRYTGIFSSSHGPPWRLLRRNVTSEVLHPTRYKSYTDARARTLETSSVSLPPSRRLPAASGSARASSGPCSPSSSLCALERRWRKSD